MKKLATRRGSARVPRALLDLLVAVIMLGCSSVARPPEFTAGHGYREAEVQFRSDRTELAGVLLLPQTPPPYPGVVFMHGSGTSDRTNSFAAAISRRLAQNGVAVLLPDKRGSGNSGGDWKTVGMETLARDGVAAVRLLQRHRGVKRDAVGVLGFSQGGRVAPRAAAISDEVAFVVNVSGSVVPLYQQMFDEVEILAEREGLSPADIEEVNAIHRLAISYGRTGRGWEEYRNRLEAARAGPLKATATIQGFPDTPHHWVWEWGRRVGDENPLSYWRKVDVPALVAYGDEDTQIRVEKNAELIQRHLGDRVALKIYRGAGHGLWEKGTWILRDDFIRDLLGWIAQQTRMELPAAPAIASKTWVCPKCGLSCDDQIFDRGGACPVCGMELLPQH